MNKDEILKLAKEHGATTWVNGCPLFMPHQLLAFADAVADAQREKDARICEAFGGFKDGYSCASAIRSKGD